MSEKMKAQESGEDFVVEIVDDTPDEDRGKAIAPEVTENDDDITVNDDEIANYKESWKQRLKELSFKSNSERRAKELAAKERDEAIQLAQRLAEENKRFREFAGNTEKFAVDQAKARAESELGTVKRLMKEAFEAGETDKYLDYQENFQRLVNERERFTNYQPVTVPETQYQIPQPRPQPDAKAVEWANRNGWFEGQNEIEKEMTGYAYAVSDMLIREQKVDPRSDKYYEEISKRVQRRFPEYFQKTEPEIDATARVASVVAPATRSTKTSRTVRLTPSQVSLAKRFGLTPEQYVAQYLKDYGHG